MVSAATELWSEVLGPSVEKPAPVETFVWDPVSFQAKPPRLEVQDDDLGR